MKAKPVSNAAVAAAVDLERNQSTNKHWLNQELQGFVSRPPHRICKTEQAVRMWLTELGCRTTAKRRECCNGGKSENWTWRKSQRYFTCLMRRLWTRIFVVWKVWIIFRQFTQNTQHSCAVQNWEPQTASWGSVSACQRDMIISICAFCSDEVCHDNRTWRHYATTLLLF